jgi:hypothetical protein
MTSPLLQKIMPLIKDKRRIDFIEKMVRNNEWITIQEFEQGYRFYTPSTSTRICDTIRESIDSAMSDEQFR